MRINPLIGFTVCSCFLIWFCLYRLCFILQEQFRFISILAIWSEGFNADVYIVVHPGSIPKVFTVHMTFSIETCIWWTLVHFPRVCYLCRFHCILTRRQWLKRLAPLAFMIKDFRVGLNDV